MTQYFVLTASLLLSAVIGGLLMGPWIRMIKKHAAVQPISEDAPQGHRLKVGTPTMGGVVIVSSTLIICVLSHLVIPMRTADRVALYGVAGLLLYGAFLGAIDDLGKVLGKQNKAGVSERTKLLFQFFGATVFIETIRYYGIPVQHILPMQPLRFLDDMVAVVIITGFCNAVNFTDGLDGLLSSTSAVVAVAMGIVLLTMTVFPIMSTFYGALAGATLSFLIWNAYPARIFMGDTGSLAIGMTLPAAALITGQFWPLMVCGSLYLLELGSMMLQRYVFKYRRLRYGAEYAKANRVFRRAPLHHHFEECGWHEVQVVTRMTLWTVFCSAVVLLIKM